MSKIAILDRKVLARRSGRGLPKSSRPGTARNTYRKGDVIYQVTGGKKNRKPGSDLTPKQVARIEAKVRDARKSCMTQATSHDGSLSLKTRLARARTI